MTAVIEDKREAIATLCRGKGDGALAVVAGVVMIAIAVGLLVAPDVPRELAGRPVDAVAGRLK